MAHELEIYEDGTASYVENRKQEIAWHRLGVGYDKPLTVAEAIEGCRANYDVTARRLTNLTPAQVDAVLAGKSIKLDPEQIIKNFKSITREDNHHTLGIVKNRYEIVQNIKAFEFIDFLTTGELGQKASIECAGVLGKGERIFITAKFDDSLKMGGQDADQLDMYAVFTNSFDGTSAVCCMITPIRVVCNNTLNMAFGSNTGRFNLRHTKSIHNKIAITDANMKNAASCLNILDTYTTHLKDGIEKLGNTTITDERIDQVVKELLCSEKQIDILRSNKYDINTKDFSTQYRKMVNKVKSSVYNGVGQSIAPKNTALFLINGLTTAFQNDLKAKNNEAKFNSLMTGTWYNKLNKAYSMV